MLQSGQVPVFDAWVEHRRQPAPMDHERPLIHQDLRGPVSYTASTFDNSALTISSQQPDLKPSPPVTPATATQDKLTLRKATYQQLAGPKGTFHDATDRKLPQVIPDLFEENIPNNSDVVILLDHTSSMGDDIEDMREMLSALKEKLNQKPGIRIGAVTFSDLKNRPEIGYRSLPFGQGIDALDKFLYETPLIGSIEDMYGAIAKTIREFNWRPHAKRTLIVISDEDPATSPNTTSSPAEVRNLCQSTQPETILHTILLRKD